MRTDTLADYAVKTSAGRPHPTAPDPYRSDFRRDIGRILYSKAFRRLAFKTQVFSPSEGDHYRNRLTHTLECAQIARVVARRLDLNEELAEVIALAHDLGHSPFGHQGEHVLNELMAPYGGFDHNLQNVRIVTRIEVKSNEYQGLNLTYETLAGIAKSGAAKRFLAGLHPPPETLDPASLEARVADLADDLAYTATDFDDFARYHDLTLERLRNLDLELVRRCLPRDVSDVRIAVSLCVRNIVSVTVTDLIRTSLENLERADGPRTSRKTALAGLRLHDDLWAEYRQLAGFLRKNMYLDANLKAETLRGADAIRQLFAHEAERRGLAGDDREGYQALCDYLSGMTDRYALTQAAEIAGTDGFSPGKEGTA